MESRGLQLSSCRSVAARLRETVKLIRWIGAGITDQDRNILPNQHLLLRTFRSVAPLLTDGPSAFPIPTKTKGKSSKRKSPPDTDSEPDFDLHPEDDFEPPFQPTDTSRTLQSLQPPPRQGTLLITLLSQAPYTLWDLPHLATRPPPLCPGTTLPQPRYRLLRSFEFRPEVYQGYEHRRTIGWREGLSRGRNEEILGRKGRGRTWEFALAGED